MPTLNPVLSPKIARPWWVTVLCCGLTAGTLDGLAAIVVYGPVFGRASVSQIFRGIASALFGRAVFLVGSHYTFYGIFLHYMIALLFSAAYGIAYQRFSLLQKNWLRNGVLYGVMVWIIMNKLVLPLAGMPGPSKASGVAMGMMILILCVGIPIAGITQFSLRNQMK